MLDVNSKVWTKNNINTNGLISVLDWSQSINIDENSNILNTAKSSDTARIARIMRAKSKKLMKTEIFYRILNMN